MDEIEERETVLLKILKNKGTGQHQHISAALPGGSVVKSPPANAGDVSLMPGSGRCLGEGNGNPLQYSCLGNPTDRGACRAIVRQVVKELDTT